MSLKKAEKMLKEKLPKKKNKSKKEKDKGGRPLFEYTEKLAKEICDTVAINSKRLKVLCKENPHWPTESTIYEWCIGNRAFSVMYNEAKVRQQDILVESQEDELERARSTTYVDKEGNYRIDSAAVALAKIKCDNIKWQAARVAPRKWSEKTNNDGYAQSTLDIQRKLDTIKELAEKSLEKHERDI